MEVLADGADINAEIQKFVPAAILVTSSNIDVGPLTVPEQRAFMSSLALFATACFAGHCYNQEVRFFLPHLLGIIGIQLGRELGQFAVASINKVDNSTCMK